MGDSLAESASTVPTPPLVPERRSGSDDVPRAKTSGAGLRLQIVLALAGLMLLAFVPLFFAVASLTRATIVGARERSAEALGMALAAHVADVAGPGASGGAAVARALGAQVGRGGVRAACVFAAGGAAVACAGPEGDVGALRSGAPRTPGGHAIDVVTPVARLGASSGMLAARIDADAEVEGGSPLVRLVALYMIVFALALLVFAYFSLTRLIVRPVEQLVDAANRVANGARTLRVRQGGARELVELGSSVQSMAEKLIAEEAALLRKVDELTEATRRLTDTRAQLVRSERMASVGRLAAGVAHEIGNPITALMGMEDLLLDGGLDEDERRDFLQRMRRETDRIHVVLRDLLDFARPEEPARAEAEPTLTDVSAVVDDVVGLVNPQKAFRTVRIVCDLDPALRVALPASRLTQVLLNLVLNAGAATAEARPVGHVTAGRVTVRGRAVDADTVRIEVEDDGPGIAPTIRDRLFEPFVTTKQVGEGTGLGLAVCRGLVESAGGEIGVDPTYSEGARFIVLLPAAKP